MSFAGILDKLESRTLEKLERKLPSWAGRGITVPASINLEQCSSEEAARYKSSLLPSGARVADLTGGLGADSWAFSLQASAVWYNERDAALLEAVRHNFTALGASGVSFNGFDIAPDAYDWQSALREFRPDVIYLDPARRDAAGHKVFLLEDCSPDVLQLMPVLLDIAPRVMVKVSPMADITMLRRRLDGVLAELHVVGVEGECKELLCICCRDAEFRGPELAEDGNVYDGTAPCDGGLLFVPSAAMVKSGLGPGLRLMAYDASLAPFGKFYEVIEDLPFASSELKRLGKRWPQAEVTARGVPVSSEELRAKIKTKPGGSVHIFALAFNGNRRLLVCKKVLFPE